MNKSLASFLENLKLRGSLGLLGMIKRNRYCLMQPSGPKWSQLGEEACIIRNSPCRIV